MSCFCHRCGKDYKVDVMVPDVIWERIRPDKTRPTEAGLLCGACVFTELENLNEYSAYYLVGEK
jgi:hypothetical protein